nr:FN3 associated domain-containing protein [Cohnella sp. WQ 127256]
MILVFESGTLVSPRATSGATIYYTTDGSTPTRTNGLVYSAPIIVNSAKTIKALAVQNGMRDSTIMSTSYTIIVKKSAMDLINEASESGDWTGINETTFANADITSVTASNLAAIISAMDANGTAPWTVSTIQAIVNTVLNDNVKQEELASINIASESGNWTGIDETTFANAEIAGVTAVNLISVQYYLENDSTPLPRTLPQVQTIVGEVIQVLWVQSIYSYLNPSEGGPSPTLDVFEGAGITGVNSSNLDAILEELRLAYWESRNNQLATPMSTKKDIQDVVDLFLL